MQFSYVKNMYLRLFKYSLLVFFLANLDRAICSNFTDMVYTYIKVIYIRLYVQLTIYVLDRHEYNGDPAGSRVAKKISVGGTHVSRPFQRENLKIMLFSLKPTENNFENLKLIFVIT